MLEKNYTNPMDKSRFGYSESGTYCAPYKGEYVIVSLIIGIALALSGILIYSVLSYAKVNMMAMESAKLFIAIIAVVLIAAVVGICAAAFGLSVKVVLHGYTCKYSANEEKFVLTIGGSVQTIYYKDVQLVHFLPRSFMGKVRGYDVTIRINGADEEFAIVFDGYLSEKNTPFFIIEERTELLRQAEELERAKQAGKNGAFENNTPIFPKDIEKAQEGKTDLYGRMAELLGKDAEMPSVAPEKLPDAPAVSKVSPTVDGYSADMPDEKDSAPLLIGDDGREYSERDIIGQGTFSVQEKPAVTAVLAVIFCAVWFGIYIVIISAASFYLQRIDGTLLRLVFLVFLVVSMLYVIFEVITKVHRDFRYKADGREFVITAKGKPDEHILYQEVLSVNYTPTKFLWGMRGYKVEILTRYAMLKYKYIFPKFNQPLEIKDLPFEIIRQRIKK